MRDAYIRKTRYSDILFKKKILTLTTEVEIKEIRDLVEAPDLTFDDKQRIELFFFRLRTGFETWCELIIGLMEEYDFDVFAIVKNTNLGNKLRAEKKTSRTINILELFE